MGGSGNGGNLGGGGGGTWSEETPCTQIRFHTTLNSPPVPVTVEVGAVLSVRLQTLGDNQTVVAVDDDDNIVGSITDGLVDLLRCLAQGTDFVAEVTEVIGTVYPVLVRSR